MVVTFRTAPFWTNCAASVLYAIPVMLCSYDVR
jgi:hypothetical protein